MQFNSKNETLATEAVDTIFNYLSFLIVLQLIRQLQILMSKLTAYDIAKLDIGRKDRVLEGLSTITTTVNLFDSWPKSKVCADR